MRRGRRMVWILLVTAVVAVVGWIVIPRVRVRIRSKGQTPAIMPATAEEQLEEAVAATMGTILGRERSENLNLVVGTPLKPTVEGVYVVAYLGEEVTPEDSFGIGVSDADSGADCLGDFVVLGRGSMSASVPSPNCTLPADRLHEVMRELRASIEEWQVPRLGLKARANAVLLHPAPERARFKLSRSTNEVTGHTTTLGPAVEQVVVTVEPR